MNSEQIRKMTDLLTVCIKAGKTVKGFDAAAAAVMSGKAACILTAEDISEKTFKEIGFVCGKQGVPVISCGIPKIELARYTGGKQTAILAVCDKGFADGFMKIAALNIH